MHKLGIAVVIPACKADRLSNETFERVCVETILQWEYRIVGEGATDETPHWLVSSEIRHRQRSVS